MPKKKATSNKTTLLENAFFNFFFKSPFKSHATMITICDTLIKNMESGRPIAKSKTPAKKRGSLILCSRPVIIHAEN